MSDEFVDNEKLRGREQRYRQAKAVKYVMQALKYLQSYLPDYPIDIRPVFTRNPVELTIRVYTGIDVDAWADMPTNLKEKLAEIEKVLKKDSLDISQPEFHSQITEPDSKDRTH